MSHNKQQPKPENPNNQFSNTEPLTHAQRVAIANTMNNNKQSMKLYTEEQVIQMIEKSRETGLTAEFLILTTTPIELPSDEEIEAHVEDDFINATEVHKYSEEAQLLMKAMCKAGALWMRDKIQEGNNEQQ